MAFIIFGKQGCSYCENAKILSFDKEQEFEYFDVTDESNFDKMVDMFDSVGVNEIPRTVPQIFRVDEFGIEYIGGFDKLSAYFSSLGI